MDLSVCAACAQVAATIITAIVAALAFTFQKKSRAEISMSYAALDDREMQGWVFEKQCQPESIITAQGIMLYTVFTIKNIGNVPFSLNEIICVEDDTKKAICRATKLRSISPYSYEITHFETPIYCKTLSPGEFVDYYWPICLIYKNKSEEEKELNASKSNAWLSALGSSYRLIYKKQNLENKDPKTYSYGPEYFSRRSFFIRFGNGFVFKFKNPNNIDETIEQIKHKRFFTYRIARPKKCHMSFWDPHLRQKLCYRKYTVQHAPLYPDPYLGMR